MCEVLCVHIPSAGVSVDAVQTGTLSLSLHTPEILAGLYLSPQLNNRSVSAAVCTKRTGKDRHLLLTTNAGRG